MDDQELRDIYSKKLKEHKLQLNTLDERIQLLESQLKNISKEPIDAAALKHLLQNLDNIKRTPCSFHKGYANYKGQNLR